MKQVIIVGHEVIMTETRMTNLGYRRVELVRTSTPDAPTEPFKGKNYYRRKRETNAVKREKRMSRQHLEELKALAAELNPDVYEHLFCSKSLISVGI